MSVFRKQYDEGQFNDFSEKEAKEIMLAEILAIIVASAKTDPFGALLLFMQMTKAGVTEEDGFHAELYMKASSVQDRVKENIPEVYWAWFDGELNMENVTVYLRRHLAMIDTMGDTEGLQKMFQQILDEEMGNDKNDTDLLSDLSKLFGIDDGPENWRNNQHLLVSYSKDKVVCLPCPLFTPKGKTK